MGGRTDGLGVGVLTASQSPREFLDRMREKGLELLSKETDERTTYSDGFANGYWQAFIELREEIERDG